MKWLIWSLEHGAWWAPDSRGYTPDRDKAGRYELREATHIAGNANIMLHRTPNEAIVPEAHDKRVRYYCARYGVGDSVLFRGRTVNGLDGGTVASVMFSAEGPSYRLAEGTTVTDEEVE